jgi:hypothetical protein
MWYRNFKSLLFLLAFLGFVAESTASSWTCRNADLVRHVTVFYPNAPARLPCKVYYSKTTENALPRVLWRAEHDVNYCEQKAEELVEKLTTLGWQCASDEF